VQTWYLQMAMYYLLAAGLVVFGVMYRGTPRSRSWRTLGVAVTAVLWAGDYSASAERATLTESQWTRYDTSSEVVLSIAGFVERTQTCFAGSVGPFPAMSNALSILLYYESCPVLRNRQPPVLRNRQPAYFELGPSGGRAFRVEWAPPPAHRTASLISQGDCVVSQPAAFAEYHLFLDNKGSTPYRYPMSLVVQYADGSSTSLAFNDNEFFADDRTVLGHLLEIAASMHLKVRPSPAGIRIFSGSQLLAELPTKSGPIGIRLCKPPWIEAHAALGP
jgi:hypothetical protein